MSRRPGSKNRSTLEQELTDAGFKGNLEALTYNELSGKLAVIKAAQEIKEISAPPPGTPTIAPEQAQAVIDDIRKRFDIMVGYYTSEDDKPKKGEKSFIPERIQEYLRNKVFLAPSLVEAEKVAQTALEKLHMHLLVLWSSKRISGPATRKNLDKRAARVVSWARRLEVLGRFEEAEKQMMKAESIKNMPVQEVSTPWMMR